MRDPFYELDDSMYIPETKILNLNNEWTVKFSRLQIKFDMEVSRKSTTETAHFSGILELKQEGRVIDRLSFQHLFRKGSTSALIAIPVKIISSWDITLKGTISIKNENFTTEMSESDEVIQHKSWEELSNNFKRLLDPEVSNFSDVCFICGSVTIPAHKSILSAKISRLRCHVYCPNERKHRKQGAYPRHGSAHPTSHAASYVHRFNRKSDHRICWRSSGRCRQVPTRRP
ncbi:hypothetical protein CEXT_304211 [Caerostris extrusa]|uniref:BTB domain-containing protein n=1 Tax=Caerostris extrusa TaxID=172846 RepID=A0AAV4MRU0_CAEEX|nr:hypothetical protein CEXT_304211 [Caerostris extrusa]